LPKATTPWINGADVGFATLLVAFCLQHLVIRPLPAMTFTMPACGVAECRALVAPPGRPGAAAVYAFTGSGTDDVPLHSCRPAADRYLMLLLLMTLQAGAGGWRAPLMVTFGEV
jgi:hypothetical protein